MKTKRYITMLVITLGLTACQPAGKNTLPARDAQEVAVVDDMVKKQVSRKMVKNNAVAPAPGLAMGRGLVMAESMAIRPGLQNWNTEDYHYVEEQGFVTVKNDPLSTFAVDVDTASYANVRRFLTNGQMPPVGAVRLEEMVNYFSYDYGQPDNGPVAVKTELGPCPWQTGHQLVRIGVQARDIEASQLPSSNLVFLVDVSGSMQSANKLGLLKKSLKMLVGQLGKDDRVSLVVYAGADRVVLPPTSCQEKEKINRAISELTAGGSTNGAGGIVRAYELARQGFRPEGNNRVILASDGDFNVGLSSEGELQRLIEKESESGIFLTVLGFGMGNYHDSTMEILADKGNGNYAYIDSLLEAKKVLVKEMAGTLHTVAKDVKLQVEFNPATVSAYRLLGYKNRRLADEDFNNDKKDVGEMGAGHTVTALYEIVPAGEDAQATVDSLKYQGERPVRQSSEILTVKLRYKLPNENKSQLLSVSLDNKLPAEGASVDFNFAAAVAGFALLLEKSDHLGSLDYGQLITLAKAGRGRDEEGYRAEFVRLLEQAEMLQ